MKFNLNANLILFLDLDECKSGLAVCPQYSYCHNTPGSYDCHCKDGFEEKDYSICADIDECLQENICTKNHTKCVNKIGGFSCICKDGFKSSEGICIGNYLLKSVKS